MKFNQDNRGEKNPGARLTQEQVNEIRNRFTGKRGEISALARIYRVSEATIRKILKRASWRDE